MSEPMPRSAGSDLEPDITQLPVDSDVDTPGRVHRPVHLHPGFVVLVIVGGCFGALARYGLGAVLPAPGGRPLPTLLINVAGAFALGVLLEALSRRGPDTGARRTVRLLVGTGFLGAFTTYSTLAVDAVKLAEHGVVPTAVLYLAASLVGGTVAAWAGITAATALHRRTGTRPRGALTRAGREAR